MDYLASVTATCRTQHTILMDTYQSGGSEAFDILRPGTLQAVNAAVATCYAAFNRPRNGMSSNVTRCGRHRSPCTELVTKAMKERLHQQKAAVIKMRKESLSRRFKLCAAVVMSVHELTQCTGQTSTVTCSVAWPRSCAESRRICASHCQNCMKHAISTDRQSDLVVLPAALCPASRACPSRGIRCRARLRSASASPLLAQLRVRSFNGSHGRWLTHALQKCCRLRPWQHRRCRQFSTALYSCVRLSCAAWTPPRTTAPTASSTDTEVCVHSCISSPA